MGAEDLYGIQHSFVLKRRDTHLECDAGDAAENFIHVKDLFRDRLASPISSSPVGPRGLPTSNAD